MASFLDSQGECYGRKRLEGGGGGGVGEGMFHEEDRWALGHGTGDNRIVEIIKVGFKRTATQELDGCDHTRTNAPDPIRTPQ